MKNSDDQLISGSHANSFDGQTVDWQISRDAINFATNTMLGNPMVEKMFLGASSVAVIRSEDENSRQLKAHGIDVHLSLSGELNYALRYSESHVLASLDEDREGRVSKDECALNITSEINSAIQPKPEPERLFEGYLKNEPSP